MTQVANPASWLAGYIPDLPTPFDETGAVDLAAFATLCERQIDAGVSAIVVGETAGEASTLTPVEHDGIVRAAVEIARGRVRVIAGAGSNSTSQAIELTRRAETRALTRSFPSFPITTSRCRPAFRRTFGRSPTRPPSPSSCTTFPPGPTAS